MADRSPVDPRVDRILEDLPPHTQKIGRALRTLLRREFPSWKETVAWGNPTYVGTERVASFFAHKGYVNLYLFRGAELAPKFPQIEGTGKGLRHVRLSTPADAQSATARKILHAAGALDRT